MTRRIGLFGGTFDPVHRAHLALARAALQALALDELRWVPAGQPWQKSRVITAAVHRRAMLELAIAGEPRFVLEPIELQREGPSYTLDTVRALQAAEPDARWWLLIGADQHAGLHTWHGWRELLGRVRLAVAARPGVAPALHPEVQAAGFDVVPMPLMDISATAIRERVARGEAIDDLVPAAVAGYIDQQALYRSADGS